MDPLYPDPPARPKVQLTPSELRRKTLADLFDLLPTAVEALRSAMATPTKDDLVAVKAAQIVFDRTGFGPKSTVTVEHQDDLTGLSTEQLLEVVDQCKALILQQDTARKQTAAAAHGGGAAAAASEQEHPPSTVH